LAKQGTVIQGLSVLGTTEDIPQLVNDYNIDHVVITIADASAKTLRRIVESCERIGVRVRTIPGLFELLRGNVSISRFRDVQIEDLLGRQAVKLDEPLVQEFLTGKRVMVTGAGGSIGSELCRQLARYGPTQLLLVERAEGALYEIDRGLRRLWPQLNISPFVADVGDRHRMRLIFEEYRPQVILHAAAHKHVPLMEQNPGEAIRNNVIATHILGEVAGTYQVEAFVMISSDKAVRPSSVMGATKRVAELAVQDLDRRYPSSRFVAVRFGNVMGSAGSGVPLFREQIERGGPVTVTHPDATRYFMTMSEASQLVLEAGALGKGGEIMVLDMGEPVKIVDLAFDMITLSGRKPFDDVPIVFTGLRPGEKINEQLDQQSEKLDRTRHPKIFIGRLASQPKGEVPSMLQELRKLVTEASASDIHAYLNELLPDAKLTRMAPLAPTAPMAQVTQPPTDEEELLH
jgi:FlaA1/EpsC-like NDP-sugar epimerase